MGYHQNQSRKYHVPFGGSPLRKLGTYCYVFQSKIHQSRPFVEASLYPQCCCNVLVWSAAPHGDARRSLWHAANADAADGDDAAATVAGAAAAAAGTDAAAPAGGTAAAYCAHLSLHTAAEKGKLYKKAKLKNYLLVPYLSRLLVSMALCQCNLSELFYIRSLIWLGTVPVRFYSNMYPNDPVLTGFQFDANSQCWSWCSRFFQLPR